MVYVHYLDGPRDEDWADWQDSYCSYDEEYVEYDDWDESWVSSDC